MESGIREKYNTGLVPWFEEGAKNFLNEIENVE